MIWSGLNASQKSAFKTEIKAACLGIIQTRIKRAIEAMNRAQEAANSDEKSSAGDKYETSRAMGHLDRDMNARQLKEAEQEFRKLIGLNTDAIYQTVVAGSVLVSGDLIFFAGAGLGIVKLNNREVITLSVESPLFRQLRGKKKNESFIFKEREHRVEEVF